MAKIKFRNNLNSRDFEKELEKNSGISTTIPNQSMTPRELMIRFAAGIPLEAGKVPLYDGDNDLPDTDKMDQIELHEYYEELAAQRKAVTDRIVKSRQKAEEIKMEAIIKNRVAERKAQEEKEEFENWKKAKGGNNA